MAIKQQLEALAGKEMDRKDFLKYSGGVALGVLGITGFVRVLLNQKEFGAQTTRTQAQAQSGYGASLYGR